MRGSSRRSVVVVAVTVAAAVGGAVAGGKLGRKAGSAAGTKLREKMQHRVARPERLDSVVGYAEQGGEFLGSVVGGTVAALVVLSLADRFLGFDGGGVLGPRQLLIGDPAAYPIDSIDLGTIPHEVVPPTRDNVACQLNYWLCLSRLRSSYDDAIKDCNKKKWYLRSQCKTLAISNYNFNSITCELLYDCTSGCCGGECVDLKTDHKNCGTCGHDCGQGSDCLLGTCVCQAGYSRCGLAGGPSKCCKNSESCGFCVHSGIVGPPTCYTGTLSC
jgi:hypothetical protein